jgi:predicted cupin superfamily sugar epimerase
VKPADIIQLLGLKPHPEGGHYCETWRAPAKEGERPSGTAIYYLLAAGEVGRWHRIDSDEIWHWYGGGPLRLTTLADGGAKQHFLLGPDLGKGERPQILVPKFHWQMAEPLGAWALAGCTVSPGFKFEGFELAQADFPTSI